MVATPADAATAHTDVLNATAQGQLKSIVERVERLEQEKAEVAQQIKEVFAEAKGNGFDVKVLRAVVRRRKQDRAKLQEFEAVLDLYLSALGELPLFEPREAAGPAGEVTAITLTTSSGKAITATPEVMQEALDQVRSGVRQEAGSEDALYELAVEIVRRDGKASTSYVQRRLQLGYNRAAALMERMEREGVISAPNLAGKREVLQVADEVAA